MTTNVWSPLVGQHRAIATLKRAVEAAPNCLTGAIDSAMTHAWLFTGPPGSGRSVAARAFAAALLCDAQGCNTCNTCRTATSGAHPDVTISRIEQLSIKVKDMKELVMHASLAPMSGLWQIIIIEDADRITDRGAGVLLKILEEPPQRAVWMLCAPNADDIIPTIRSRLREVRLVTPSNKDIANLLTSHYNTPPDTAEQAARACGGHIGRAKALAADQAQREARQRIVDLPTSWTSLMTCLNTAAEVVTQAQSAAEAQTTEQDAQERRELEIALGFTTKGAKPRTATTAIAALEEQQKARAKRLQRDAIDNVLTELATWYRDVLATQLNAPTDDIINIATLDRIQSAATVTTAQQSIASLEAILNARQAIDANVAPLLAIEALFVDLMSRNTAPTRV